MGSLDWRRAAAREIEKLADFDARIDARIATLQLERARLLALNLELRSRGLARAIELLDEAILEVARCRQAALDARAG